MSTNRTKTIVLAVSEAANGQPRVTGTGTIKDNDDPPTVSIDSPSVTEGDSGSKTLTYTVRLTGVSSRQVTVDYADAGTGTATSGTDYTAITGGTFTFAAGTLNGSATFDVSVTGDTADEPHETIVVALSNPTNATVSTTAGTGTGTINDDDPPAISIDSPTVTEGGAGSSVTLTFTVSLSSASGERVSVNIADVQSGTATRGTDYNEWSATGMRFSPGETTTTLDVTVIGDEVDEADETILARLSSPVNATIAVADGTGTITDDDPSPTVSISTPTVDEGDTGSTRMTYTVTLDTASGQQVTVDYEDAGTGTATSGTDYEAFSKGTLTFAAGETSKTFDITLKGDTTDEVHETVLVTLSNPTNATVSTTAGTGTGTITDDDGVPTLSIDSPSVTEGDSGSVNLTYTATLSAASGKQVTVAYADATTGTATSGTDYTAISGGTLTFAAETTSQTFDVSITGDAMDEPNETILVTLSGPTNAVISTTAGTGTGTITDNDDPPGVTLALAASSIPENGGTTTVTATLGHASSAATTVTVTAVGGSYTVGSDATITIAAGETANATDSVTVTAVDDDIDNVVNRSVTVTGTAANARATADSQTLTVTGVTLTLTDDEATPTATLALSEPDSLKPDTIDESGAGNASTVTASLNGKSSEAVTLTVAATGATAAAGDFSLSSAKTLTIASESTTSTGTVTVAAVDDTTDEADETVTVSAAVSGASGVANPAAVTLTIADDDAAPSVSISSPGVTEGASGSTATLSFEVTLSAASGKQVKVAYADATTGTATSGTDYTAISGGTLTFAAGETSRTVDVTVTGDGTDEPDETVIATLSNAANATIGTATGTGTITDDDAAPSLSIDSPSVTEGDSGSKNLTFTATLSPASGKQVTVQYADAGTGTATSGTDYTAITGGTLTFAAGTTSQTFAVSVTGDVLDESNETVLVSLSAPTNAVVSNTAGTGTGTITDDDGAPSSITLTVDDNSVGEGDGATTITVTATVDGTTRFSPRPRR